MTNEPSPRPWRCEFGRTNAVIASNGAIVVPHTGYEANAALIVEAVNERDRLRDIVRRTVETLEQVYKHAEMTDALREVVTETQREARAAIGEGENPTGKGVGR